MRYALIEEQTVINVIEAAEEWVSDQDAQIIQNDDAQIGWSFVDGEFIAPPAVSIPDPTPLQKIQALEMTITSRRVREAILGIDNGWLSGINKQIAGLRSSLKG